MQSSQDDIVGAWPPPDGVVPNFTNPESIAIHLILAAVICPLLTALFVGLRLFTSYFILKTWHADDILIVSALAFAIANSVLSIIQTKYGAGVHIWDVPMESYQMFNRLGIVGSITYNLSTLFIKASILTMYLRFSIARALRIAIYLTMFVAVGYSLAGGFGFLYLCHPIPKLWDFSIPGSCGDFGVWYLSCAALNVATDALILLLPIWILWPMRIRFAQRLAVLGVLMAGGFVLGVSALRLSMMLEGLGSMDATWVYLPNLVWCLVEIYTGIACACLPSFKPFLNQVFPRICSRLQLGHQELDISRAIDNAWGQSGTPSGPNSPNVIAKFGNLRRGKLLHNRDGSKSSVYSSSKNAPTSLHGSVPPDVEKSPLRSTG